MKKIILSVFFLLLTTATFSQVNFYKLTTGIGFGPTVSYADVRENSQSFAAYATIDYNLTPFFTAGLEIQNGQIKGGDIITNPHNREFKNNYTAATFNTKIALGQFVNYAQSPVLNVLKGLYAGVGLGAIRNKMDYIVRYKPNTQTQFPPLGYKFPGVDRSTNLLMPINLGLNLYFKNNYGDLRYTVNINYQANFTFNEGLDGYNDPPAMFKNNRPDIYTLFSVGFKYSFGPVGISKKIF